MKKVSAALIFIIFFLIGFYWLGKDPKEYSIKRSHIILGTLVEIQVRDGDDSNLECAVNDAFNEIKRIDSLFSTYNGSSIVSVINRGRDTVKNVNEEIRSLIKTSDEVWKNTDGAFDPGINHLIKLWGFDTKSYKIPGSNEIKEAIKKAGWKKFSFLENGYLIKKDSAELNFNGIAKGYAVDKATEILKESGIDKGIINAGGEIRTFGDNWIIGIQDPGNENEAAIKIRINDGAIATSGDYENYFINEGKHYHHLIDPATGWPPDECRSVTIIGNSCTIADAYSTGIFVMGVERGLKLIEQLKGIEGFIIDKKNKYHYSTGLKKYLIKSY